MSSNSIMPADPSGSLESIACAAAVSTMLRMKTTPGASVCVNHWSICPWRCKRTVSRTSCGMVAFRWSPVPFAVTRPIARIWVVGTEKAGAPASDDVSVVIALSSCFPRSLGGLMQQDAEGPQRPERDQFEGHHAGAAERQRLQQSASLFGG